VSGVIVNARLSPSFTVVTPLGVMPPFAPALAVTVQVLIANVAEIVWSLVTSSNS